jgi:anaerobic selenocysteine-containing dehydrogenase
MNIFEPCRRAQTYWTSVIRALDGSDVEWILNPIAGYTPSYESSQHDTALAREYALALITPANHYFLNSIFANTPRQQQRAGPATLLIHPDDAALRSIATGDEVRIANARGVFFAVADVCDCIRPGVVASTKDHWPGFSKGGATTNATVDARDSDMGRVAVYHDNRVRVDKVSGLDARQKHASGKFQSLANP